jgi:hypothetical protein
MLTYFDFSLQRNELVNAVDVGQEEKVQCLYESLFYLCEPRSLDEVIKFPERRVPRQRLEV